MDVTKTLREHPQYAYLAGLVVGLVGGYCVATLVAQTKRPPVRALPKPCRCDELGAVVETLEARVARMGQPNHGLVSTAPLVPVDWSGPAGDPLIPAAVFDQVTGTVKVAEDAGDDGDSAA